MITLTDINAKVTHVANEAVWQFSEGSLDADGFIEVYIGGWTSSSIVTLSPDLTYKKQAFIPNGNHYHNYFYKNENGFLNMIYLEKNRLGNFNSED